MNGRRRYYRRADWVTLALCAALLVACLGAIGTAGRERAKRTVCLSNLKALTQAWRQFADDHDGQLVNGMAGVYSMSGAPWVNKCWANDWYTGEQLPEATQEEAIENGGLWPYLQELNLYRCPSAYAGEMLNYAVVDSMNGLSRSGTSSGREGLRVGDTVLWVQNFNEIITPGPAERMVFIDEGWISPDSFGVNYQREAWWDDPTIRHNDGTTSTFADGHAEYWQWKGTETIEHGRRNDRVLLSFNFPPQTPEGREDLHRLQRAVWGRLGYELTEP